MKERKNMKNRKERKEKAQEKHGQLKKDIGTAYRSITKARKQKYII